MPTQNQRLIALTQTAIDAIVSANGAGRITDWNPAAEAIFGYSCAEAVGQPLELLMPERFRAGHVRGLQRVVSGGPSRLTGSVLELAGRRKSGEEFPIELSLARWEVDGEIGFTGIIRDISRRRRIETELSRMFALVAGVLEGHVLNGHYRMERKLSVDDVSVLYEGTDLEQRGPVAIKVLRPGGIAGAPRGWADTIPGDLLPTHVVDHKHAVEVLDQGRSDIALPFVVTELLSGETLAHRIARRGLPRLGEVLVWVAEVAEAVSAAHAIRAVHGSVGASSVFIHEPLGGRPTVKVVDFGVMEFCASTLLSDPRPGHVPATDADDVWGLGALLVELCCGSRPDPDDGDDWRERLVEAVPGAAALIEGIAAPALNPVADRRCAAVELAARAREVSGKLPDDQLDRPGRIASSPRSGGV